MSTDPWGLDQEQSKQAKYAEHTIVKEVKGNWVQYDISLTPIETDKPIKSYTKRSFLPDWNKISLPSLRKIFNEVPSEERGEFMNRAMSEISYIKYYWEEYKDYDKQAITKKKNDGYEQHLDIDSQGREYIKHLGIHYLAIWFNESEWRKDAELGETQPAAPPTSAIKTNNGNTQDEAVLKALPVIVQATGTDLTKLAETLALSPFSRTLDNPVVKQLIIEMINKKANGDIGQQVILLAEINTHSETPYLELSDLTEMADEVPF